MLKIYFSRILFFKIQQLVQKLFKFFHDNEYMESNTLIPGYMPNTMNYLTTLRIRAAAIAVKNLGTNKPVEDQK
jgi:hypothetical protein